MYNSVEAIFYFNFIMKHILRIPRNHVNNLRSMQSNFKSCFATSTSPAESSGIKLQVAKNTLSSLKNGPGLRDFINITRNPSSINQEDVNIPYLAKDLNMWGENRKVFFETYGCQMNVNDTEVIWSILKNSGFQKTDEVKVADVVLVVTCSIREGAENKIWHRIKHLGAMKKTRGARRGPLQIGILGCMAERLKTQLLEKEQSVDIVAGPDSYRDLPRLLAITRSGPRAANVLLSLDETYADIMPVRLNEGGASAFVSIMRGCDNMCSYCIVPFTRGRERSRPIDSIVQEIKQLEDQGIKEVTLLGQNVNSYRDLSSGPSNIIPDQTTHMATGFRTVYKNKIGGQRFADLLHRVASAVPDMRIRFTSPHPKDFPDEVLHVIRDNRNICRSLHLPAQSGSSTVLERMRRGYTREAYLELVEHIRSILPGIAFSSDFICGFCGETEDDFQETLTLMDDVKYHVAYLFAYSMREKTTAHRRYTDDVPEDVKGRRLRDMVKIYRKHAEIIFRKSIGEEQLIMIEGLSKRSPNEYYGRNDQNIKVIIPNTAIALNKSEFGKQQNESSTGLKRETKIGDFVAVKIQDANSQIMKGLPLYHTTIQKYYSSLDHFI